MAEKPKDSRRVAGGTRESMGRERQASAAGTEGPRPIRRVEIPKPDGKGVRLLGIPTVLDRLIQQSILQVLTPVFDPHFSESSYGFRPGRGCHDAVVAAQAHVEAGTGVELDRALELARGAQKIRPDDPIVQDTLGWAMYKKGENAKALDLLAKAQGKLAGNPEVNYHLGMALVKAGKKEQGKKHLEISIAPKGEYPWKAEAARTLARI